VGSVELLFDPQAWVSFLTLAVLEIVLGIDNVIFLSILVDRLPRAERRSARLLGLSFAMLTRLALLFSVIWLTTLRTSLFTAFGLEVSCRDLILFAGGAFLVGSSAREIRHMIKNPALERNTGSMDRFWLVIVQIGLIDIVFSLDTVFTAIGLAKRIEVMVAAIVVSVPVMMGVSSAMSRFIERHPTVKTLALALLVLVGLFLIAESLHVEVPQGYLYFAMAFGAAVEAINIPLRRRG
jgi:predicted tellurium resistance membrane protein TerC